MESGETSTNTLRRRGRPRREGKDRDGRGRIKYPRGKKRAAESVTTELRFLEEDQGMNDDEMMNMVIDYDNSYDKFATDEAQEDYGGAELPRAEMDSTIRDTVSDMHQQLTGQPLHQEAARSNMAPDVSDVIPHIGETESDKDRLGKMRMLRAYMRRFPDSLDEQFKAEVERNIDRLTDSRLDDYIMEAKLQVFHHSQPAFIKRVLYKTIRAHEHRINAVGLADAIEAEPEFQDLLDEVTIKHQHRIYLEPEHRLVLALAHTVSTVIKHNLDQAARRAGQEPPAPGQSPMRDIGIRLQRDMPHEVAQMYADL